MSTLHFLLAFVLMLGPLVAVHEFGHFYIARRMGVKVLVFSIGFGPVLYKRIAKDGTQYQIAAIPLGGYVKMADEREGEVPEKDLPFAFNRQSVYKRMAIVAAGPLINLLFAVFLFWLLYLPDSQHINTRVGEVVPNSAAAQAGLVAGDKIIALDGKATPTLENLHYAFVGRVGDSGQLDLTVERQGQQKHILIPVQQFLNNNGKEPFEILGFYPFQPKITPTIKATIASGAADKQGLKAGDTIVKIDNVAISSASQVKRMVQASPDKLMQFTINRPAPNGTQTLDLPITPTATSTAMGIKQGQLQVEFLVPKITIPPEYVQTIHRNPVQALGAAVAKTWHLSVVSVKSIAKLVTGQLDVTNVSGVITIASVSNEALKMGLLDFIGLMALMSVSLGVMNLLPIPVLDGGHLVFYTLEAIMGKPLSEQTQQFVFKIGFAMLITLMGIAFYSDFLRYDIVDKVLGLFNDVTR